MAMEQSEWKPYQPNVGQTVWYKCPICGTDSGILHIRDTKESNDSYREYRIRCMRCGSYGRVHRSVSMAVHSWHTEWRKD